MRPVRLTSGSSHAVLLLGIVFAAGCHSGRVQTGADEGPALETRTMLVQSVSAPVYAVVPGSVVSKRHAEIASRLSGYVLSVAVQAGDRVVAGQPLLKIDSSDVTGNLQQAQAELNQAQAVFDEAQTNFDRANTLYAKDVVSKVQLDAATRQYATAKAGLDAAQAALRTAQAQLGYADLRAPFAGVVVDKLADPGDLATPGKPLLVLEDERALEVQSYVPDELYPALRIGEEIPFTSGDVAYHGRLESKVESADIQTHTHLIRIAVPNDSALMSGRYVRVSIPTGNAPQMRIPASALTVRAGITGVFVVGQDDRAWFRLVRVGSLTGGVAEIQSGLVSGERIVLAPGAQVDNGTHIAAGAAGAS